MITLATGATLQATRNVAIGAVGTIAAFGCEVASGVETFKPLLQTTLGTTPAALYTVPSSTITLVKTIIVVNSGVGEITVSIYAAPTTTGASSANKIAGFNLPAGCMAIYEDEGWTIVTPRGQLLVDTGGVTYPGVNRCQPPYLTETFDRHDITETNVAALTSGQLFLQAIWLEAGMVVRWISFCSATTAGATLTNQLFGLFDSSRNQLAVTSNDTTTAWAANTVKTLLVTTPYTVTTSGLYYVGIMVAATTVPTLKGPAALTATQVHGAAPIINGNSSSGLTTSLPNPAAAITVSTTQVWGAVS